MKTRVVVLNRKPLYLASASQVSGCEKRVIEAVSGYHRANPLREGITKEVLRAEVDAGKEIFEGALRELIAAGKIGISGDTIKSAGRSVTLSDEEARARGQIESAFERAGFAAPASKEVLAGVAVDGARAQKILQLLLREGVLSKGVPGLDLSSQRIGEAERGAQNVCPHAREIDQGDRFQGTCGDQPEVRYSAPGVSRSNRGYAPAGRRACYTLDAISGFSPLYAYADGDPKGRCSMGEMSPIHWLIVLAIIVLLFGGKKIPEVMRGLGEGIRNFREGMHNTGPTAPPSNTTSTTTTVAPPPEEKKVS